MKTHNGKQLSEAGRLLVLFVFLSCCQSEYYEKPTFREQYELFSKEPLYEQYVSLTAQSENFREEIWKPLQVSPVMYRGDDTGLRTSVPEKQLFADKVELPHRIPAPYTAIWYRFSIRTDTSVILLVNADDGAQLFINDSLRKPVGTDKYRIAPSGDEQEITVRVLNQAMQGGLRGLYIAGEKDYNRFLRSAAEQNTIGLLIKKYLLLADDELLNRNLSDPGPDFHNNTWRSELDSVFSDYPLLIAGPLVTPASKDSLVLRWEFAGAGECEFRWGNDSLSYSSAVALTSGDGFFSMKLPKPVDDPVYYQIKSNLTYTGVYNIPAIQENDSLSIAFFADSQGGWETFARLAQHMQRTGPGLVIGAGDLVAQGSDRWQYRNFSSALVPAGASAQCLLIAGNHDYDGYYTHLRAENYLKYAAPGPDRPYYFHRQGPVAVIGIDANMEFPLSIPDTSDQYRWLIRQMDSEDWREAAWRILVVHQPPYTQGWPGYTGAPMIRELTDSLAPRYNTDLILCGHTHDYERKLIEYPGKSTLLLICGTGGGNIEPDALNPFPVMDTVIKEHLFASIMIRNDRLQVKAIDLSGQVTDEYTMEK
ncbi:MAG: metallophosphoesterase [Bacteroidales bacterium]